ncbi:HPF/RaiA family ribosome-associated protein [Anabaena cylindrica FACHB-243]|uniref:Cold-shock protein DNA-binding protein n=1 Tax=Anabaena cylindrica (strain ATCC 27899 / PCC 7122) TaxID=272123 RepID=K9ZM78_ANACC|nr:MULTISPECIES: HPF/RaiA family ribosome-associated protein [Anabaena]AFZ59894.1 Cold-shock protein DNA-binding protein [Anabaena cylindrica PCC 7122]MBD2416723.1 HPF/RaiA family ribosome-associated protein [Anabaena cylindrica FACHB-243]MBY5285023.1 cold shock domain-containing protein [Anabaena sp. CCAP 1446/1C]MBY5310340.1 cold shock domain-containing protein [Anabaena sp. CCAP 1446/1C]MCM2409856.1 HPF/RaiA family ribosome-associated protein [Anabaena sp. CCAP 1446/1C]
MKITPAITYRNLEKSDAIDTLIQEKIAKLEHICNYINNCQIVIEKIHERPRSGSPYRVRIDLTVPPGHELVAEKNPGEGIQYQPLDAVIRETFDAMRHQLAKLTQRQRANEQSYRSEEAQESIAFVTKLFRQDGYGFLKSLDGQEIYFHHNSVLHHDFDRLEIGTGVHFSLEQGEEGPQASSVKIVDKPGVRAGKSSKRLIEPPLDWQE